MKEYKYSNIGDIHKSEEDIDKVNKIKDKISDNNIKNNIEIDNILKEKENKENK